MAAADRPVTIILQHGEFCAVVDPFTGGRLTSLTVRGDEVIATVPPDVVNTALPGDPARKRDLYRGSFPLAPWTGTLGDGRFEFDGRSYALENAVHGLVAERGWDVVDAPTSAAATLAVRIGPGWPGDWPVDAVLRQEFRLDASGLHMRLEVQCDDAAMPAIAGFHPWFRRSLGEDRQATVSFSPGRRLIERDGRHLTTVDLGPRPWDDLFVHLDGPPSISWPGGPTLALVSSAPIWVYYERMPEGFCIEPWTGPGNGLRTCWRTVVAPGSPLVLELSLVVAP
jgi:galactose mutarotase-like enzyme